MIVMLLLMPSTPRAKQLQMEKSTPALLTYTERRTIEQIQAINAHLGNQQVTGALLQAAG